MTYLKVKNELSKDHIAIILKNAIMKKYFYEINEELIAVIDKYERKYKNYLNESANEDDSNLEDSVKNSRLYASQSVVIEN